MGKLFPDTSPEFEAVYIEMMRAVPGWRRLEMVEELNKSVRMLAYMGLRDRFPEDSPQALRRKLADILLGKTTAQNLYAHHANQVQRIGSRVVD